MRNSALEMKFIDHVEVRSVIPNGVYLTCWLADNLDNRRMLIRFRDQVMANKDRKASYVRKGGLMALFVNNVALNTGRKGSDKNGRYI